MLEIYKKYPSVVKAIQFVIDENVKGNFNKYHGMFHLFYVFKWAAQLSEYASNAHGLRTEELLVAALFHDAGHVGKMGDDSINIAEAQWNVDEFSEWMKDQDPLDQSKQLDYEYIKYLIECTQFPYTKTNDEITIEGRILRDADMSYFFEDISIFAIYVGLREEFGKDMPSFLETQGGFITSIKFNTPELQLQWEEVYKDVRLKELNLLKEAYGVK